MLISKIKICLLSQINQGSQKTLLTDHKILLHSATSGCHIRRTCQTRQSYRTVSGSQTQHIVVESGDGSDMQPFQMSASAVQGTTNAIFHE